MTSPAFHPGVARPVTSPFTYPAAGVTPSVYVAGQQGTSYPDTGQPPPGINTLAVPVTLNAPGDWMIAVITWRWPGYGTAPSVSVSDGFGSNNYWDPIAPAADSSPSGLTRTAVWIAPAARVPLFPVTVAPTGFCLAIAATIYGVPSSLISKYVSVTGFATTYANASGFLSLLSLAAPASAALVVTGFGADLASITPGAVGGGWNLSPVVTSSLGGGDTSSDILLAAAWQQTTGLTSMTWSTGGPAADLSGAIAGLLLTVAAPAQPNPTWPVTYHELAIGSGSGTQPAQLAWTQAGARVLATSFQQGRQYTLGQLQAGQGTITFDNPDLALTPPGSGAFAGIDSGTPYRQRLILPWSVTPHYVVAAGFMQRWPPSWDPALLRGQSIATLTDQWGYANKTLKTILRTEILYDQPVIYCPCGDAAGSAAASNLAPGGVPMVVTQSKYGTGGAAQAFGTQPPTQLLGDVSTVNPSTSGRASTGGSMWTTSAGSGSQQGYCLAAQSGSFPPLAGGVTVECFFQLVSPFPSAVAPQPILTIANSQNDLWFIYADPITSHLLMTGSNQSGTFNVGQAGVNYDSQSVLTHFALQFFRTGWTSYVNGVKTNSGSFSPSLPPGFTAVYGLGAFVSNVFLQSPNGFIGHVAVYAGILPAGRILAHYYAGLGYPGETASQRIERLLQAAGLTGRRCILRDTSFQGLIPVVSCQDTGGQPASAALTNIAASTTPAVLSVAPTGAVAYLPVQDAYNQAITWTLGDSTSAGEIPFLPSFAPDYDPVRVVNDIAITGLDDQAVTVPAIAEASSVAQYGDQTYAATGYLQGDALSPLSAPAGLQELANWIAAVSSKPKMRLAAVTVQAAANTQSQLAWAFYAGAAVGDIVQCNFRPPTNSGQLFAVLGRITQTDRHRAFSQDETTAVITCTVDTCPEENILTADDPVRGQLNGLNVLGW